MPSTTPNFGFEYPLATDNLSDGAQSIQDFATTADTTFVDLKGGTTGQYLTKTTNTDMDFSWTTLPAIPAGFPKPGAGYYTSNRNFTSYTTTATPAYTSGNMVCIPVYFSTATTLDRIAIEVTTGVAASTCRLGIYDDDGTAGAPGTLIADFGTVACDTNGVKELTISQSVSGLVYLAFSGSSNSMVFRALGNTTGALVWNFLQYGGANTDPFTTTAQTVWRRTGVTGAFPNPAGASMVTGVGFSHTIVAVRSA